MSSDRSSAGRPQLLIFMAASLISLAAIACVVLPLMHVSAVLAAPIALMALIPIVLLLSYLRRIGQIASQAQRAAEVQRLETDRNQQAIMRLLDEMSNLAEGDLTVQATVTEDITGAIADSVNYAVEALRKLVATISQSGIQLDGAARQTQALLPNRSARWHPRSRKFRAMPSVAPMWRVTRWTSPTRVAMPCAARSTA
jgi:methyl-accepting chemotaxis protein